MIFENKKFFKKLALFFLILILILGAFDLFFDALSLHDMTIKQNWIFKKKNQKYAYAILGSSRAYTTTDAELMSTILGKTTINLGLNGATYPELDMVLEKFVQENTIQTLLLEVDIEGLDNSEFKYPFQQYNYLPYFYDPLIYSHIKNYYGIKANLWRYVPFYRYIEFNSQSGIYTLSRIFMKHKPEYDSSGSCLIDRPFFDPMIRKMEPKNYRIDNTRLLALVNILNEAKKRNIKVVLYVAPEYPLLRSKQLNYEEIIKFYYTLAKNYNADMYIYDYNLFENKECYFKDASHVNKMGAIYFTKEFAAWLKSREILQK